MFNTISVLLPTRKRVSRLEKMLTSLHQTCKYPDAVEVVCRCDHDDRASQEFLRDQKITFITGPRRKGYGSLPSFMNECARLSRGDLLLMCNDDCFFKTKGWDIKIRECANQYPDGIFNIGVKTSLNDDLFPFSIVSRRLLDVLGFINDERLIFSDIFLLDLMKEFGRTIKLPTVSIEHDWANPDDDNVRFEASIIENSVVFDGTPGDEHNPKGNWKTDYLNLHNKAVREAVDKIRRADIKDIISEKKRRVQKAIENYFLKNRVEVFRKTEYECDCFKEILQILIGDLDLGRAAFIVPFYNWQQLKLWGKFINQIVSIRENAKPFCTEEKNDNCDLVSLPVMDLYSLNLIKDFYINNNSKTLSNIDIIILEDAPFPKVLNYYFVYKKIVVPKSRAAIVFVHKGINHKHNGNHDLVNKLRDGNIDCIRHSIVGHVNKRTQEGFSIEIIGQGDT